MKVSGSKPAALKFSGALPGEPARHVAQPESRALIPVTPIAARQEPLANYREASFLAQLIATKQQMPQTRGRRRVEPHEAIAAYRAVEELVAPR